MLWMAAAILVLVVAGGYYWQKQAHTDAQSVYVTELSGTVKRVWVDVNDLVTKGQILVELDTAKFSDQVLLRRSVDPGKVLRHE